MAELSRNIKVKILVGLEGPGVDEAVKSIQKISKGVASLTDNAIKAGAAFVAFKGLKAAFNFGTEAVNQANLLERGLAGMSSVFGTLAPQMLEFVQNSSNLGMSMAESSKAVTFIGSVLKQSGFAMDEVATLTKQLITLGADLAYTYGYDVQEALMSMTALFRGEYDPIEKFGVAMKQNEIETIKQQRELDKLTGLAEIFADQQIRIELLFSRSADAAGNYAKNTDSLFIQQQNLAASFRDVQAIVGLALTPTLSNLALNMIPLVDSLTPVLVELFKSLIPVVEALVANKQTLITTVVGLINIFGGFITALANTAVFVVENFNAIKNLLIILASVATMARVFILLREAALLASQAVVFLNLQGNALIGILARLKLAIARTGFGLIALAIGATAAYAMSATQDLAGLEEQITAYEDIDWTQYMDGLGAANAAQLDFAAGAEEVAGGAGKVKDAVGDFYRNLQNEMAKQSAKMELQSLGASEGLINMVLGSGEDWYQVFQEVTRRGMASVREVQRMFSQTAAGFDEAMQEWQKEYDAFLQFKKQAEEARDSFIEFVREFEILPTIERQLGRFEQAAATQLSNIEDRLKEAFDNKYLLEGSYRQLLDYARREFEVLQRIERQRDEILARRDAAEAMIKDVNKSILSGARLVGVLRDIQSETDRVDIASVVKRTVQEARTLREFEIIVTSAVVEPIEEVVSQSQALVNGYRDIVERTRAFVSDMKALRALGLDPTLFNDLVEAGVDAGGATARALVEGGADTVNEVNSLFSELNKLGEELGEQTAQVMYGQGEMFVDGIVKGLEAQAAQLEEQAKSLALAFTTTFEQMLIEGILAAIAAAEAALSMMPKLEGMPDFTPGGPPSGTGSAAVQKYLGGLTSGQVSAITADKILGVRDFLTARSVGRQDEATLNRLKAQVPQMGTPMPSYANPYAGNFISGSPGRVIVNNNKVDQSSVSKALTKALNTNTGPKKTGFTSLKPGTTRG